MHRTFKKEYQRKQNSNGYQKNLTQGQKREHKNNKEQTLTKITKKPEYSVIQEIHMKLKDLASGSSFLFSSNLLKRYV